MSGWRQIAVPGAVAAALEPGTRCYVKRAGDDGFLSLMVSPPFANQGWHLSIAHKLDLHGPDGKPLPGRYPTWDEMRDARYEFIPDEVTMALLLPPRAEYVNVMPTTFHMHEIQGEKPRADR